MRSRLPLSLWALIAAQIEAHDTSTSKQLLPTEIRKMPPDSGAKFHHYYCAFPQSDPSLQQHLTERDTSANSTSEQFQPPFAVIYGANDGGVLQKRQWACPSGTNSCASIGYPNSCCQSSLTCQAIQDTGSGPVGCCPAGTTCGGGISGCADDGSTACSSDLGGGCCIPGFVCSGVGCIKAGSSPTTITTTSTSIISQPAGSPASTVLVTVIITITPTPSSSVLTSTVTSTATDTNAAGAPIRPTSSSSSPSNSPSPSESPSSDSGDDISNTSTFCPTGFYACKASAGGGCCQTGRDCATTSCPPMSMTTIVSDGVTVVVPAIPTAAPPVGTGPAEKCADGWFLCGRDAGPVAGCCPSGYNCGQASCTTVGGGATGVMAKVPAGQNSGTSLEQRGWWGVVVGLVGLMLA
ncbi:hypothetical protein QBC35DRAFT_489416 [Podospora australis]|uniref:GPI anchored protein n=1 Tax=Podospora australis TaxID=1536484 RepID=A0AAN6X232_9PEZI|nr:hypothetical protein QBC35DRAFT_489416 [Podospora australis]